MNRWKIKDFNKMLFKGCQLTDSSNTSIRPLL